MNELKPKPIPPEILDILKNYYKGIAKRVTPPKGMERRQYACMRVANEYPRYFRGLEFEDVYAILTLPHGEEKRKILEKLKCPKCLHGNNLEIASRGLNSEGKPQTGYDIYCRTPDPESTIFTRCWYHLGRKERV